MTLHFSRGCVAFLGLIFATGVTTGAEEDAIKAVTAAGGKVTYDKVAKKKAVGGVVLSGPKITNAIVRDLLQFPSLTRVEIKNAPKVTADAIEDLAKVKQLQVVELSGPIASDATAKTLAGVTTITELRLTGGSLTDDGVKELAALSKLETLGLAQNKKLRGTTIPSLVAAKNLKYLTISNCELGDLAGWSALKKLPKLTGVSLPQAAITDAGLKELGKLTRITSLNLDKSPITDAGLAELRALGMLDNLSIQETKITEKAVPILSQMRRLSFLTLSENQIGKAGAEALKKALPKCDVNAVP